MGLDRFHADLHFFGDCPIVHRFANMLDYQEFSVGKSTEQGDRILGRMAAHFIEQAAFHIRAQIEIPFHQKFERIIDALRSERL